LAGGERGGKVVGPGSLAPVHSKLHDSEGAKEHAGKGELKKRRQSNRVNRPPRRDPTHPCVFKKGWGAENGKDPH